MNKKIAQPILYILCLYIIYLYLPDALDIFGIQFYAPEVAGTTYFDAVLLLFGGALIGWLLIKLGGRFNKSLGWLMIVMNVVLVPLFIFRAIP